MAPTTPLRRPRRTRRLDLPVPVPGALCLLLGLLAIGLVAHTAMSPSASAPPDPVEVTQTLLQPGTITFQLRNDNPQAVTIAQVAINDAFWPFTATSHATIAPHGTSTVTLHYPWDAGMSYDIQFISSTGAAFEASIAAPTAASSP